PARAKAPSAKGHSVKTPACRPASDPILDAAERVAQRDGVGRVTLDAVASEAGLSKSGLIHHYPSKDALIGAMVLRMIDAWGDACDQSIARRAGEPAGAARGLIEACFECPHSEQKKPPSDEDDARRGCIVIAALVHDTKHIEPVRKVHRRIDAKLAADRLPTGLADVVHLALNGMWFNWVFNLSDLTPQRLKDVRGLLERLVDHPELLGAPASSGAASPARINRAGPAAARSRKRVSK
ncbi:MAG: TetR/AcrR family transcriptional regulator, partial [Phycisphaerales bacterium]|nr:TetR/AcrR family transcriptional regulator [Phycisphaerales bacterium]